METNESDTSAEQLVADLGFLNETAMGFLRLGPGSDLYQYTVERLAGMVGDCWAAISTFHPDRRAFCLRAVTGPEDLRARALRMIGEAPIGCYWEITDEARMYLLTGRLHKVPGGLYEAMFERVPRAVAKAAERFASIREIYSMGCVAQGELIASFLILLRGSQRLPRAQVIEAFVNQAAVAIQRDRAEERLRAEARSCRAIIDQVVDLFVLVDRDLTIVAINRQGSEELGHEPGDLLGKNIIAVLDPEELGRHPLRWDLIRSGRRFVVLRHLRRADGTRDLYQARVNPLPDGRMLIIASAVSDAASLVPGP